MSDPIGAALDDLGEETPERGFSFDYVEAGPELVRILSLPRRRAPAFDGLEEAQLADFLSDRLALTAEPYPGRLRPLQGAALHEAWSARGLAGFLRVGAGKTQISLLLPAVLGEGQWLLAAPKAIEKGSRDAFQRMTGHWPLPKTGFRFVSYEKLAHESAGEDLDDAGNIIRLSYIEQIRPALIVLDEAHQCSGIAAKRIGLYLRKQPNTIVILLTGTPFRASIRPAARLLEWALGDKSPLPRPSVGFRELQMWEDYLSARKTDRRAAVGALLDLCTPAERIAVAKLDAVPSAQRRIVRRAVARRMYDTLGVISSRDEVLTDDQGEQIGLTADPYYPLRETDEVTKALGDLHATGQLPDGTGLEDGLSVGRHATTLAYGFWLRYDPQPPPEYRLAWQDWSSWCMKLIKSNRRGIDSAARVMRAVRKGLYDDEARLETWLSVRDDYRRSTGLKEPPSVPVWISDEAVESIAAWVEQHQGAVWVHNICLGRRLSDVLHIPYYQQKSKDAKGTHVLQHPGGPAILSLQSCGTGKNLQAFWSKNLWCCVPGEQALGRTHRSGTTARTVENWVYLGCAEHARSFERARDIVAEFQEDMTFCPTKLRIAECTVPTEAELSTRGGPRWAPKLLDD